MQQELTMRDIVHQARSHWSALLAFVIVLGFVAADAGAAQRRGRMTLPPPPTPVDSTPQIDVLKKALKALAETDRDYSGHREKAINHINIAIRDLALPTAQGKKDVAAAQEIASKTATTNTTPQAESDASLRKARESLFKVYHQLEKNTASKGQVHAKAQVKVAIDELVEAQKPPKPAKPTAAPTSVPASAAVKTAR
jgi:hypothetical protein